MEIQLRITKACGEQKLLSGDVVTDSVKVRGEERRDFRQLNSVVFHRSAVLLSEMFGLIPL